MQQENLTKTHNNTLTIDMSIYEIAKNNRHIDNIKNCIGRQNLNAPNKQSAKSFKSYFNQMSQSGEKLHFPIKEISSVDLRNFLAEINKIPEKDAVNVFIKPAAEALAERLKTGNAENLALSDLQEMNKHIADTCRETDWISEQNRVPLKKLYAAADKQISKIEFFNQPSVLPVIEGHKRVFKV